MSLLETLSPAVPEGRSSLDLPGTLNVICLFIYAYGVLSWVSVTYSENAGVNINEYKILLYSSYLHEVKWNSHYGY